MYKKNEMTFEKPKEQALQYLGDIITLIQRFVEGDIKENKQQWENILILSLQHEYKNYCIKNFDNEYKYIYQYLYENIDEMGVSNKTKTKLKNLIFKYYGYI